MPKVIIGWVRYSNFFDLYAMHKNDPKLIYVIGESHHCYIGSVGSKGGTDGLAQRYQKQYIDRARAIFGAEAPQNQPAYMGHFVSPSDPSPSLIAEVEKTIQKAFLDKVGTASALFTFRGFIEHIPVANQGADIPPFLVEP